jgi:homoserine dehydrogenase
MKSVNTVLLGLGAVNRGLLKILVSKRHELIRQYNLELKIIVVADSSGVAINADGFDYQELLNLKNRNGKVLSLKGFNDTITSENIPDFIEADLLIESSPGNLKDGNPGLSASIKALQKGWSVVFANKAPLIFAFDELHQLSNIHGGNIAYSATVCGGLPVVNVLKRDLKAASLIRLSGIFNATSNYILQELEQGGSMEDAIKEAQRIGAAEADPSHDTHGHDTANKLFIIMKSFTNFSGSIHDIEVMGIQHIQPEQLLEAKSRGNRIKLLASAEPEGNSWKLSVKPTELPANSFLGMCDGWEMGIEIRTDFYESISMKNYEADPLGTSAAVLRDAIDVIQKNNVIPRLT